MYEYDSRVRLTEVDENQKMTLMGILNAFQNCSTFHSEDLGVGMAYLTRKRRMWVLRSWKIVVAHYPKLAEHIRVGTWPYAFDKMTGRRNFRLLSQEGELAACADSMWVYMDMERMRPARVDEDVLEAYTLEPKLLMEYEKSQITLLGQMEEKEPFSVHSYQLDVNHHVNNGQYVQMAREYLPKDFLIGQMRAEYKKPAVLDDVIYPKVFTIQDGYTVLLADKEERPYAVVEFKV